MEKDGQVMLLRNKEIEPTGEVLENALGEEVFGVCKELLEIVTKEFGLEYEWRYYNDGKAWLCKLTNKKKTIFWLSIWEKYVKTSFFFTQKTRSGVFDLPISEKIKEDFDRSEATGKLIPLILDLKKKEQLKDFQELVKYKKSLK
ncbi:MAG: DUF3788 domain-containing protein [Bacteroidales bacterium]|jgi:hypothetical protein|nr:DUF3788 domain-containing protein [Bacteroidales bacterium]